MSFFKEKLQLKVSKKTFKTICTWFADELQQNIQNIYSCRLII